MVRFVVSELCFRCFLSCRARLRLFNRRCFILTRSLLFRLRGTFTRPTLAVVHTFILRRQPPDVKLAAGGVLPLAVTDWGRCGRGVCGWLLVPGRRRVLLGARRGVGVGR